MMPMQLVRSKEKNQHRIMVHGIATVMNIAKPVLPTRLVKSMTVFIAVGARIGFMLLALDGKLSTAILLVIDSWSRKCITT